jgi:hypothetical protein
MRLVLVLLGVALLAAGCGSCESDDTRTGHADDDSADDDAADDDAGDDSADDDSADDDTDDDSGDDDTIVGDFLEYQIADAEYSDALDGIVAISADPDPALHILDPETPQETTVSLPDVPLCVSVGPSGLDAAVGHDGSISYVDLAHGEVVAHIPTTTTAWDIVMAGNGYAYVFPLESQWEQIHCVNVETEVETVAGHGIYQHTTAKLQHGVDAIYGADNGLSPSDLERYDLSDPTNPIYRDSPYHGEYEICGDLWMSGDGARIFTGCGNVFRSSAIPSEDMIYNGSVQVAITFLSHSVAAGEFALIPWEYQHDLADTEVRFFRYVDLAFRRAVPLPTVRVNGHDYPMHGRFVFYREDGSRYYAVIQADGAAGLLHDFRIIAGDVE